VGRFDRTGEPFGNGDSGRITPITRPFAGATPSLAPSNGRPNEEVPMRNDVHLIGFFVYTFCTTASSTTKEGTVSFFEKPIVKKVEGKYVISFSI
jgi:hypothetical protein